MGCWKRGYYYSKGQYVGKGEAALVVARLDALELAEALRERERIGRRRREDGRGFREARLAGELVDRAVALAMAAAGFRRHARGQWRRSRMNRTDLTANPSPEIAARMRDLIRSTDPAAIAELKRLGEVHPAELIEATQRRPGGPGRDDVHRGGRRATAVAVGPGGQDDGTPGRSVPGSTNPVLRLAVEAAVYRWLDHWLVETQTAQNGGSVTRVQECRRTWAHRRYLQSLAYVARIARLTRPRGPQVAVQIINNNPPAQATDPAGRLSPLAP